MDARIDQVRQTVERIAALCGVSTTNVIVGSNVKTGCRLTRSGIDLLVNHEANEDIAHRNRYGVRGSITLEQVDVIAACFVSFRAQDFFLDDWCQQVCYGNGLAPRAQRYLQASIDDLTAYARMTDRVPFANRHFAAYLSRMAEHVMSSEPLHLQLMRALRLYVFEEDPHVVALPEIVEELGTTLSERPLVTSIRRIVFDSGLGYHERHEQAASLLAKPFAHMLKQDEANLGFYDLMHLYDDEQSYSASKDALEDESALRQEVDASARAQTSLKAVSEDNIDQLISDNNEPMAGDAGSPNLALPSMPTETAAIALGERYGRPYGEVAFRLRKTIEQIAEVLSRIATPQEQLSIPRYRARLVHAGSRMHPGSIVRAQMQLASGQEQAIWQKVHRRSRPQDLHFQGMDIYLLLDTSISMTGENATSAAEMAVCLIEGIDRAAEAATHNQKQGEMDLRTQLLAFGEGWGELTPLETDHSQRRKQFAFSQLLNPTSEQTLVAAALEHVRERALADPSRDVLCLVVGDGLFADGLQARKCALSLPCNVRLAHITIGEFSGLPLTGNFETIRDPTLLPEKLGAVLAQWLEE